MGTANILSTTTQPYTGQSGVVSTQPLTSTEKTNAVEFMMSKMGLTEAQAKGVLENMTPAETRTFLGLISGKDSITRAEAISMWGLSEAEADILFPKGTKELRSGGIFTNPFGNAFLNYLILSYSLGLDIRRMMADMLQTEIALGIEKANEIFTGAIVQFACALTSAVVTGLAGGVAAYKAKYPTKPDKNQTPQQREAAERKAAMDAQWYSPIGASLVTQPINAGGEFGKQWYEHEGALTEVFSQEAEKLYQQLLSFYQSNNDTGTGMARNL